MPSTFVNDLRLEEIATGEQSGTWGATTNTNLELIAEAFSYGSEAIADASTHTITVADGATDEARSLYLKLTGGGQACTVTLAPNTLSKVWLIENATSFTLTLSQGSGANVDVLAGEVKMIATDGAGSGAVVYDLLTDVNLAGTTSINALKLGGTSITTTAAEFNILDGGTSASSTTVVDADRVVFNDDGTMKQVAVTDLAAYFDDEITAMPNLVTTAATTVGALNSGSISSGFGNIDIGSSNLTATGTVSLGAASFNDNNITNVGSIALDTITNDGTDITLDSSGDIVLDAGGANVTIKDDGTSILDIANNSTDVEFTVSTADKNFKIKGTDSSSVITALDIDMALAGKATFNGDVSVGAKLLMPDNTAHKLLIADGTSYEEKAVGDLSEISTVANDDVFLAVDTTDGALKKITRSAIVAGLSASGAISNVVEDSTPQLGGDLDVNGNDIVSASNGNIAITPNGSGVVRVDGSNGIDMQSGAISIKNSGSESYVRFYCESSNAHYTQLQAAPHSAYSGNVTVVLPANADTLVGRATTDTLTNKTLTSPVLNTATVGTSIVPASADGAALGSASAEFSDLFLADGGIIKLGNDQDVTITHVADTGILLNSTSVIQFNDASQNIGAPNATTLDINATDEIELNATLVDVNANLDVSGTYTGGGLMTTGGNIVIPDAGNIGSASDTDAIAIASNGVVTFSQAVSGTSADFDGGVTIDNITIDGTEIDLSSGDLTVDVAGDIILDADGGDFKFQDDGTEILRITNSSSDVIIRPVVDAKDIIFQQRDGTEVARVEDNGTFNIVTDKLAINGTAVTSTAAELNYVDVSTLGLTEASKAVTADSNGVVSFDNGTIEESTSVSSSSGAATINLRDGNVFEHDLTENVTYTFSNPASSGRASAFILKVIQDSTARSITWPNSVDWAAATAPTITTTNNGVDVFGFLTIDGGTTYYGFTLGQAMG